MKTYVAWTSYDRKTPNRGFWDHAMLEEYFAGHLWNPVNANEFEHVDSVRDVPRSADGAIVVLHARSVAHEQYANKLNDEIMRFRWVIVMLVSDEEGVFPAFLVKHRNMKLYVMMPHELKHRMAHRGLPNGYPTPLISRKNNFNEAILKKPLDWFFSGQDTHVRRHEFVDMGIAMQGKPDMNATSGAVLFRTEGFTQGMGHDDYYRLMSAAKVVPCPSGAAAPDSFRLYEALELGCIPVADNKSPDHTYPPGYWNFLFRETPPFPIVDSWYQFPLILPDLLKQWPANANRVQSWWQQYKRKFVYQIEDDINSLRGSTPVGDTLKDKITVLISSSPIPSHPSAGIIQETIDSVRRHLPDSEIMIMCDGVRPEQEHMRAAYEDYKWRLGVICRRENLVPYFYDEFLHQAEMTKRTLEHVRTPYILFVEHDTPLCDDPIEWKGVVAALDTEQVDFIRFHHMDSEFIHPEHMYLAIDKERQDLAGIKIVRTDQYSQRPHVASVEFYKAMLALFSPENKTFIEDHAYQLAMKTREQQIVYAMRLFRMAIYAPDGHIKRSRDLNGRAGGPKFDATLRF